MSKILLILSILFFSDFAFPQGDAPAILKGQNQVQKAAGAFIVAPAQSVTKVNSSTALIETGNTNILENPGFEHGTYDWAWVVTSGTASVVNSSIAPGNVFSGLKSMKITASSSQVEVFNSSPTNSSAFADGVQLLGMMRVKTNASGLKVCSRVEFTTSTTNCVSVVANNKWNLYKIPFIGGNFFHGVVLTSQGANVTGDTYVDDAFVGAVDLKVDVPSVIRDTASSTSMTYSAATSGVYKISSTITTTNRGVLTVDNSGSATRFRCDRACKLDVSWAAVLSGASTNLYLRRNGSSIFQYSDSGGAAVWHNLSTSIILAASEYIELGGTSTVSSGELQIVATSYENGSVYSSTNADTDFASATCTSSHTTNTTTTCKVRRDGGNAIFQFRNTYAGAPNAALLSFNLPSGYVIDTNRLASVVQYNSPLNTLAGAAIDASTANYNVLAAYDTTTAISARAVRTVAGTNPVGVSTNDGVNATVPFSFGSGDSVELTVSVPIVGWSQSNIAIAQLNGLESCATTAECTDVLSAKVSTAAAITEPNLNGWLASCVKSGTNSFITTCTPGTGTFTQRPNCVCNADNSGVGGGCTYSAASSSSTSLVFYTDAANATANLPISVVCQKQGSDYIGKTAKAVASDQNIATPGMTKVKSCYYSFGGTSSTLTGPTICTASPCVEIFDSCGVFPAPTRGGTGSYTSTSSAGLFANNTFVHCDMHCGSPGGFRNCNNATSGSNFMASDSNGALSIRVDATNQSGTASDSYVTLECTGAAP